MGKSRRAVIAVLTVALVTSGCQTGGGTVVEYRPAKQVVAEAKAPDSRVFELVRWQPISPSTNPVATTHPTRPARQIPVEVERRYLARGQRIGFVKQDDQLFAVAGDAITPLIDAHYEWKYLAPESSGNKFADAMGGIRDVTVVVLAIVLIGGLIFYVVHESRHHLLDFDN